MPVEPTVGPRGRLWLDGEGDAMRGDLPPGPAPSEGAQALHAQAQHAHPRP